MKNYFALFLILMVVLYFFSAQTAMAGSVVNIVNNIVDAVVDVVATIVNVAIDFDQFIQCDVLGSSYGGGSYIDTASFKIGKNCPTNNNQSTGAVVLSNVNSSSANCYEVPLTFYNQPEMNVDYLNNSNGYCERVSIDETNRNIVIYRFTLPGNSSQSALNNWYYGIKNQVGNGWLSLTNASYWAGSETSRLVDFNYQSICGGSNTCKFTDSTVPQNVYVAYVAKILGPYNGADNSGGMCLSGDDKFLIKTINGIPGGELDATQISGPYKVPICLPPTVNLQTSDTYSISKPTDTANVGLSWNSTYADSCVASGDWSGSKNIGNPNTVSEYLPKPRGDYSFTLGCSGAGGSVEKTATTKVIQIPQCNFSADKSSIVLPDTATLSWSCDYVSGGSGGGCSINQNIGSVGSSGSKEIRPSKTTSYLLTCNGLDGSNSFETTVNINTPLQIKYQEVIPR